MILEFDRLKSKINKENHGIDFIEAQALWEDPDLLEISAKTTDEQEQKRVNVDFPLWMIQSLDKEAKRLGIPRQSIIKIWLADRLQQT